MRFVQVLAFTNATLAVVSALLCAAPFTPAIFFFLVYAPLAALFAALNHPTAALVVVMASVLAWILTPLRYESEVATHLYWHIAWVVSWSIMTVVLALKPVRSALLALLGVASNAAS